MCGDGEKVYFFARRGEAGMAGFFRLNFKEFYIKIFTIIDKIGGGEKVHLFATL
jgi:hypothetical protein